MLRGADDEERREEGAKRPLTANAGDEESHSRRRSSATELPLSAQAHTLQVLEKGLDEREIEEGKGYKGKIREEDTDKDKSPFVPQCQLLVKGYFAVTSRYGMARSLYEMDSERTERSHGFPYKLKPTYKIRILIPSKRPSNLGVSFCTPQCFAFLFIPISASSHASFRFCFCCPNPLLSLHAFLATLILCSIYI